MTLTQISTAGVKDDAVTSGKIPANAVGSSELADNAVDTAAIADQAVTLAKLPHGTGSNDGKFLRANNGADPTFETVTGTTINNNGNNRVITGSGTANTLEGEANLTWDATTLKVQAATPAIEISGTNSNGGNSSLHFNANVNHWVLEADNYTQQNAFSIKSGTTASSTPRLTISSDGRVGIGKTPSSTFDIETGSNANGFNLNCIGTPANYFFNVRDDNVSKFFIKNDGKIGIGTDTPDSILHCAFDSGSTAPTSGTTPKGIGQSFGGTNGHNAGVWFSADFGGDQGIAGIAGTRVDQYQTDLRFYTNSTGSARAFSERMRIDSSGKVGIGTDSPDRLLHVEGNGSAIIRLTDNDTTGENDSIIGMLEFETKDSNGAGVAANIRSEITDTTNGACSLAFSTGTPSTIGTRMTINSSGRVDIGNAYIEGNLYIGGTASANALDDYEEGTFSAPYYQGGTFLANADGRYTKIGNRVFISIFEFVAGQSTKQDKDLLYITGLPFSARSEPNSLGTIARYSGGNHQTIGTAEHCYIAQGGTQIKFDDTFNSGTGNWTVSLVYEAA